MNSNNTERPFDLIVFGASGFTGRLIAENLQSGAVRFADAIRTMTDSPSEHAVKTAQEFGIPVSDGRPFAADPSGLKAFYESLFA